MLGLKLNHVSKRGHWRYQAVIGIIVDLSQATLCGIHIMVFQSKCLRYKLLKGFWKLCNQKFLSGAKWVRKKMEFTGKVSFYNWIVISGDHKWFRKKMIKLGRQSHVRHVSTFQVITLRLRKNGSQFKDIFRCIFLYENLRSLIRISLNFVPNGPINNKLALVQMMAWHWTGD